MKVEISDTLLFSKVGDNQRHRMISYSNKLHVRTNDSYSGCQLIRPLSRQKCRTAML